MKFSDPAEAKRGEVEAAITAWRDKRDERLELDRQAAVKKKEEDQLYGFLVEVFKQQKLEGMLIEGRVTGLGSKKVSIVEDKEALMAHIRATGELELLQFRLSEPAVKEREENGESVPGVGKMEVYSLFDRKS